MKSNSISSLVHLRETGSATYNFPPFAAEICGFLSQTSRKTLKLHSENDYKSQSELIWLGGKENILATLNSHGQAVFYNLLSNSSAMLSSPSQHVLKLAYARDSLFMAVRENSSSLLSFYLIPLESLQNNEIRKVKILESVQAIAKEIKEIDAKNGKIVLEKLSSIQIWDMFTGALSANFPKNQSIECYYSEGWFCFWEVWKNTTKVGLISLESCKMLQFEMESPNKIYLCQVIGDKLLMGMSSCLLNLIDIATGVRQTIGREVPSHLYQLEDKNAYFLAFPDNSLVMINENGISCMNSIAVSRNCLFSSLGESAVVYSPGKLMICRGNSTETINIGSLNAQQIGTNSDTNQIFLASKGMITVIE